MLRQNVNMIRAERWRVIRGTMPQVVRRELSAAVAAGELVRLPKQGLLPEVFCHPDHRDEADKDRREKAIRAVEAIGKVLA